jgi:hypothetical protein
MDESLIRGLVVGGMFAAIAFAASLIWKLFRSQREGARRTKIVLGVVALILIGTMSVSAMGAINTLIATAIIAALVWIMKGFKRSD